MVDDHIGIKYMRSVDHRGLGYDGDNSWLIKHIHEELTCRSHPGVAITVSYSRAIESWPRFL